MTGNVSFKPFPLLGDDAEGQLILIDDRLAAVVSRLDGGTHLSEHDGQWFVEAGFGPCQPDGAQRLFRSLEQAGRWVARRSSHGSDHCCGGCSG